MKEVYVLAMPADDLLLFRSNVDAKLAAIVDSAVQCSAAITRLPPPSSNCDAHFVRQNTVYQRRDGGRLHRLAPRLLTTLSLFYGQRVLTGVDQEKKKSNRVVESILSTLRPRRPPWPER